MKYIEKRKTYNYPDFIDEPTAELIDEWFSSRTIIPNFDLFFNRSLKQYYPRYLEMLRVDPTVSRYDWFVENYVERQTTTDTTREGKRENTETSQTENTTTGTNTSTGTSSNESTQNTTGSNSSSSSSSDRSFTHARLNPYSQEYNEADVRALNDKAITAGEEIVNAFAEGIAIPYIKNPTASNDTFGINSNVNAGKNKNEIKNNGNTRNETSQTVNNTNTGTADRNTIDKTNETGFNLYREVMSGRSASISSIIENARATIEGTTAWEYFYNKLNMCFLAIYEEEEE